MNKKNIRLGIVLIILIAAAYLYKGPFLNWKEKTKTKTSNFISQVEIGKIDKLEINQDGKIFTLFKNSEKWKVEPGKDFYANESIITTAISALEKLKTSDFGLASDNESNKAKFGTDSSGIGVKAYEKEKAIFDLTIGQLSPDYLSTYIANNGQPKTYLVKVDIFTPFHQADWRDTVIFSGNADTINKLRMQIAKEEYVLEKNEAGEWKISGTGAGSVNQEKVKALVEKIVNLNAVKIPEQSFANTGLEKNLLILEASGPGVNNTIMIGDKTEENNYYAKKGDNDNIYLISEGDRDVINKTLRDLR